MGTHSSTSLLRAQPAGLGWVAFTIAIALPWLLEPHVAPWTMFFQDTAIAAVLLALAAWAGVQPGVWRITPVAFGVGLLAIVPLVQAAAGRMAYPADGLLASLHLTGFGLAILTGLRAEAVAPGKAADALFSGLAIAALLSVGLQLYQWQQLDGLGAMVVQLPSSGRPFANLGQPNLLATLLVWGLVAVWWAREHERIGPHGAVMAAAFLLAGVAMTQSRAGWLEVTLLAAFASWRPRSMRRTPSRAAVAGLALWFVAAVLVWPQLASVAGMGPARALTDTVAASERLDTWRMAFDAIAARPWQGWGWNQGTAAQLAVAGAQPSWQPLSPYKHNVVLDLLVWNGVPIGLLATLGFAAWYVRAWRRAASAAPALLLLALATLLIHSMLELPHGYAVFLLPAGLMIGMVEAHVGTRSLFTLPRWGVGTIVLLLALALGLLAAEFQAVADDRLALRMRAARIANLPALGPPPQGLLMAPHDELLASIRVTPGPGLDASTLALLDRVAHQFPSAGNLHRLAQADALNGRPEAARDALALLCRVNPPADCLHVARVWRETAAAAYPALAAIEPPSPPVRAGNIADSRRAGVQ